MISCLSQLDRDRLLSPIDCLDLVQNCLNWVHDRLDLVQNHLDLVQDRLD